MFKTNIWPIKHLHSTLLINTFCCVTSRILKMSLLFIITARKCWVKHIQMKRQLFHTARNLHISKNGLANPVLSFTAIGGFVSTPFVSNASWGYLQRSNLRLIRLSTLLITTPPVLQDKVCVCVCVYVWTLRWRWMGWLRSYWKCSASALQFKWDALWDCSQHPLIKMTAAGRAGEKKLGFGRKIYELKIPYSRTETTVYVQSRSCFVREQIGFLNRFC